MDRALKPDRFQTNEEWEAWKRSYQAAYRVKNRERRKLVLMGEVPKMRRDHEKRRH